MSLPKVVVIFSNGNLLADIAAIDGIAGMLLTVDSPALIGVAKTVFNLADAETQGFTEDDEPFAHRHIKEFYTEVAGNQELWLMGTVDTMTMAQALDHTDIESAVKLIKAAESKIRLLGIARKPDVGYDPGIEFLDTDVSAAVLAAKTFCEAQLTALRPLRVLIEGRISDEDSTDFYEPNTAAVGYAGVVLGGSEDDGTASIGLALGRAVKFPAHIKIGKVANGPLSIPIAYIGTKNIKELANLEALHDKGYIVFMKHPQKAGVYFGKDNMASIDDYRRLVYGRVVDKAAIIANAVYTEEIESEVTVDPATGFISELDIKHLEGAIRRQINVNMADQISALDVIINPAQDIINTETLTVKLEITPKGYTSTIIVQIGLKAPTVS